MKIETSQIAKLFHQLPSLHQLRVERVWHSEKMELGILLSWGDDSETYFIVELEE